MATLATLTVRLVAESGQFKRELSGAQKAARGFTRGLQTAGTAALGIGLGAATAAVGGFAAVTRKTLPMASDFQSQLADLKIAAGDSGMSFQELHDAALAVGGDTRLIGVSASGAADSLTGLYKAGLSTTEIFGDVNGYMEEGAQLGGALRAAIDLAAASELDMVQASDLGAVALSTFGSGLETAEQRASFVNDALDNMVKAADASVADVSGLAMALKNVGPSASAMGLSIEDTNNALAILSTRGIEGGEAGTALKSMLTNLQRPTDAVQSALTDLNVSLYDAEGQFIGMPNLIGQLEDSFSGLTDEQKNLYAQTLAGTEGMNAFNALIGEGTEGWQDMADATANAAGIQEQAAAKAATFKGLMEGLEGTLETVGIKIGEALLPAATSLITTFGEIVEDVGPAVTDFFSNTLGPALETAAIFIEEFAGGLSAGVGPIEALQAALVNVGFDGLATSIGNVAAKVGEFWAQIQPVVSQVANWVSQNVALQDVLIGLGAAIASVIIPILASVISAVAPVVGIFLLVVAVVAALRAAWESNFLGIQEKTQAVIQFVRNLIQSALSAIQGFWQAHGAQITAIVTALWAGIKSVFQTAFDILRSIFDAWKAAFQGDWRAFGENMREAWGQVWDAIKRIVTNAFNAIKNIDWGALGKGIIDGIKRGVQNGVGALKDAVKAAARAALEAAKGFLGIESPSRAFQREVGLQSVMGWAKAFEDARPLRLAVRHAAEATVSAGQGARGAGGGALGGGRGPINVIVVEVDRRRAEDARGELDYRTLAELVLEGV